LIVKEREKFGLNRISCSAMCKLIKAAIIVGKPDNLIPIIDAVIAAVSAGELDGYLSQISLHKSLQKAVKPCVGRLTQRQ